MQRLLFLSLFFVSCFALAPLFKAFENRVNGSYIIVYHDKVPQQILDQHKVALIKMHPSHQITHSWEVVLHGYAAILSEEGLNFIRAAPEVSYVEEDQLFFAINFDACTSQSGAPWGLGRISVRQPSDATNTYRYDATGAGVRAFVLDTGIYRAHSNFGGRAQFGISYITGETGDADLNGHGTHVAGTIAGSTYGVAKGATVVAVKVLSGSGSGSTTGIVSGLDYVGRTGTRNKDLVNMSLGGGASTALDNGVNNLNSAGILCVVAAGNDNANSCNYSPARASGAFTVGATQQSSTRTVDNRASFSNWGSCVDIFAPGESILSTWIGGTTATRTISGTSMASPHVAGAAAVLSSTGSYTPSALKSLLINQATTNTISNPGTNSPNRLLYSTC